MLIFLVKLTLVHLVIAIAVCITVYYGFQQKFLGKFWGGLIVAVIASFLSAVLGFLFKDFLEFIYARLGPIDLLLPIIICTIFLLVFSRVSKM